MAAKLSNMSTKMEPAAVADKLVCVSDPDIINDRITRILIVHDARPDTDDMSYQHALADFVRKQGYHVVTLAVDESQFANVPEFIKAFDAIARDRDTYAMKIVHYARTTQDLCVDCCNPVLEASPLLKIAFGAVYVHAGNVAPLRCVLVHPPPCCVSDMRLPPKMQIEAVSVIYNDNTDGARFNEIFWDELTARLHRVQRVDDKDRRHVRTTDLLLLDGGSDESETEMVKILLTPVPEQPLLEEDVIKVINANLVTNSTDADRAQLAESLGMSRMTWNDLSTRTPEIAVRLLLRKTCIQQRDQAMLKIADALENIECTELAQLARAFGQGHDVFLSHYPTLANNGGNDNPKAAAVVEAPRINVNQAMMERLEAERRRLIAEEAEANEKYHIGKKMDGFV